MAIVFKRVLVTCRKEVLLRCDEDDDLTEAVYEGWPEYQAFADNDIDELEVLSDKKAMELLEDYKQHDCFAQWVEEKDEI